MVTLYRVIQETEILAVRGKPLPGVISHHI